MKPSLPNALKSPLAKAYLALLVVYFVWGTTYGAIHIAVTSIEPAIVGTLRFTLAGILLVGLSLIRGEKFPTGTALRRELFIGFFLFFAGNSISFWAVQHMPTGIAGALVATNPFWMVLLLALIPPKESVPPKALAGLFLGFTGLVALLYPKMFGAQQSDPAFWLSLLGVTVMVFFWALGTILVRKFPGKASVLMGLGIQNGFAGLLLAPLALVTVHPLHFAPTINSLIALGYIIVFGSAIATACYYYTLSVLPVPVVATFAYVSPVITILFGWLFLRESVSPWMMAGTAIILSGVGLVQTCRKNPPAEIPTESVPELSVNHTEVLHYDTRLASHSTGR